MDPDRRPPDQLACDQARDLLSRLLDGELGADTETRLRRHLRRCAACAYHHEVYRGTVALARWAWRPAADELELPRPLVERYVERLRAARRAEPRPAGPATAPPRRR